jgi:hypothetical protein
VQGSCENLIIVRVIITSLVMHDIGRYQGDGSVVRISVVVVVHIISDASTAGGVANDVTNVVQCTQHV